MPELFTGTVVGGKYKVVKRLGRGGFGAVYLVEDTHLGGERFALKIPHDHLVENDVLGRFRSEAQRLNRLSHPNIVGFRGFFEYPGERVSFFLLEYVDGPTLKDVLYPDGAADADGNPLQGKEIGVARSLRIAREVLQALEQAHRYVDPERGPTPIVHRDVKPENVLLAWAGTPHECAKVLDFGIARVVGGTRHTKTGTGFVGTGVYASPEQAKGKKADIDARTDVFACGTMLYELLTGRLPFDAENEMGAILQRQDHAEEKGAPVPPFSGKAPGRAIPPAVEAIARKAQELKPDARYQSAREMIEAIDDLGIEGVSERRRTPAGAATPPPQPPAERAGARRGTAAGVALLCLVGALGAWAALGGGKATGGVAPGPTASASPSTGGVVAVPAGPSAMGAPAGPPAGSTASSAASSASTVSSASTAPSVDAKPPPAPVGFLDLTPKDGAWLKDPRAEVAGRVDDPSLRAIRVEGLLVRLAAGGAFRQAVSLTEGANEVTLEAGEGLRSATRKVTLLLDTKAPALTIGEPKPGALTREAFVALTGQAKDANLASVEVDGIPVTLGTDGSFQERFGLSDEGERTIAVVARDRAGNEARAEAKVVRDTRPPEITVAAPRDGLVTEDESVDLDIRVRDPHLASVLLDGKAPATQAPPGVDASLTGRRALSVGENRIEVAASDGAGNQAAKTVLVTRKEKAAPPPPPENVGWLGERLPQSMRRGREKPVVIYDTGKGLEIEMVYVPAGPFKMGEDRHEQSMPTGFYIGRYETTWREYRAFYQAEGRAKGLPEPSPPSWGAQDDHPVVKVGAVEADAYCTWVGLVLPSDEQWEKAARGTDGRKFPWGDQEYDAGSEYRMNCGPGDDHEIWKRDGAEHTAPVGQYENGKSPWGAYDMAGNVWEWTSSTSGPYRRYRGGGWYGNAWTCSSARLNRSDPSNRSEIIGFRPSRVTTE